MQEITIFKTNYLLKRNIEDQAIISENFLFTISAIAGAKILKYSRIKQAGVTIYPGS